MKLFFDTSVLVAAVSGRHPKHATAFAWLERTQKGDEGFVSTHALAELFAVLTGHPSWRVSPADGLAGIEALESNLSIVDLRTADYKAALSRMAELGLTGGGIYDALHARAALKVDADVLLTYNAKHFTRLGEDVASLVKIP